MSFSRFISFLNSFLLCFLLAACSSPPPQPPSSPSVLVSIAPHKYFVERIAGNTLDVHVLVPPGVSPHSYEPSPQQVIDMQQASLWFTAGDPFERQVKKMLQGHRPQIEIIDTLEGIRLLKGHVHLHDGHPVSHESHDNHVWLSPRLAKIQAQTIAHALMQLKPQNKPLYHRNLEVFLLDLEQLHVDIEKQRKQSSCDTILVSHPAFSYFSEDYDLKQLSIEHEGRAPLPQDWNHLVQEVQQAHVTKVIVQPQHDKRGAVRLAQQLNLSIGEVDPYNEEYLENMRHIARLLLRDL